MRKLILTDVDETCLEFANPFQRYCEANGYKTASKLRDTYHVEEFLGLSREECVEIMKAYCRTPEGSTHQPSEVCAATVLPQLYAAGYDFVAITACGTDEGFRTARTTCLNNTFGFTWKEVHTVPLLGSKADVLRQYPASIWVEDHFGHAVDGAEMGHRVFLLSRTYNEGNDHPLVTRVKDWHEIAAHLAGDAA